MEYAMRSRAKFGLIIFSTMAMGGASAANGPGVTHVIENGEPLVFIRLVPAEEKIAPGPRVNALATPAAQAASPADEDAGPSPTPRTTDAINVPLTPEPAAETPPDQAASNTPPVSRYPSVRPKLKPNEETGVGGALDLVTPPEEVTPAEPKPMRLNAIDRPRRSASRERQRTRSAPQRTEEAEQAPANPDPLDAAAEPIVLERQPVDAVGLPLHKNDARIANGN